MKLSVLTYNVLFNRAYKEIGSVLQQSHPDIICLQEVDTNESNLVLLEKSGYKLADYSNSFIQFGRIFGVATYYNPHRCSFMSSQTLNASNSLTEMIFTLFQIILGVNKPRTMLETVLVHKSSRKKFSIYNAHLLLFATNAIRLKHLKEMLESFIVPKNLPTVICGDFNYYPYDRKKLEHIMKKYRFLEATKNIVTTVKFSSDGKFEKFNLMQRLTLRIINKTIVHRLKTDYVFYKQLRLKKTTKVDTHTSDHFPILAIFDI